KRRHAKLAEHALTEASSLAAASHERLRGKVVLQRARLLREQGHPDEALRALRALDGAMVDAKDLWFELGSTFYRLGKPRDAASYFQGHHKRLLAFTDSWCG